MCKWTNGLMNRREKRLKRTMDRETSRKIGNSNSGINIASLESSIHHSEDISDGSDRNRLISIRDKLLARCAGTLPQPYSPFADCISINFDFDEFVRIENLPTRYQPSQILILAHASDRDKSLKLNCLFGNGKKSQKTDWETEMSTRNAIAPTPRVLGCVCRGRAYFTRREYERK